MFVARPGPARVFYAKYGSSGEALRSALEPDSVTDRLLLGDFPGQEHICFTVDVPRLQADLEPGFVLREFIPEPEGDLVPIGDGGPELLVLGRVLLFGADPVVSIHHRLGFGPGFSAGVPQVDSATRVYGLTGVVADGDIKPQVGGVFLTPGTDTTFKAGEGVLQPGEVGGGCCFRAQIEVGRFWFFVLSLCIFAGLVYLLEFLGGLIFWAGASHQPHRKHSRHSTGGTDHGGSSSTG